MTDEFDRREDKRSMPRRYESITTDSNLNINEHGATGATMSKLKNGTSINSIREKRTRSCSLDNAWTSNDLPGMNLPEKILFVVDTAKENECTPFEARTGGKFSPLYMIKRVIEIFISAKSGIDRKHEYALMALKYERVSWICDFTNDRKVLLANLEKTEEDPVGSEPLYDLGPCFEAICDNTNMELNESPSDRVSRVIFIYARSRAIPVFQTKRTFFERLYENSHFYLDCLYVHEPPNDDNECQKIYSKLVELDVNRSSYILEVGRNLAALHTNMAKLTAHPLQRARQDDSPYAFNVQPRAEDAN